MELDLLNIKNELKCTNNYNEIKNNNNNNWILNTNILLNDINNNNESKTNKIENVIDNNFSNLFEIHPKPKKIMSNKRLLIFQNEKLLNELYKTLDDLSQIKTNLHKQNEEFLKEEKEKKKEIKHKKNKNKNKNEENKKKNENWEIKKKEMKELIKEKIKYMNEEKEENNENLDLNLNVFNNDFKFDDINNQINQLNHYKIEKIKKQVEEEKEKKRKEEEKERKKREEERKKREEEERKREKERKREEERKKREEEERKRKDEERKKREEEEKKKKEEKDMKIRQKEESNINEINQNINKNEHLYLNLNESNGFIPIYNNIIENLNQNITNEQLYNYIFNDSLLFNTNKFSEKLYFLSLFYQKFKPNIDLLNDNEDAKKYFDDYAQQFSDILSSIDSKNDINKENKLILYFNEIVNNKELFIVVCNIFLGLIFQTLKDKSEYKYFILFSMMINKFNSNKILINLFFQKITTVCSYVLPFYHEDNLKNSYKEDEKISEFTFRQSTYLKLFFCYIYLNLQEYINYINEYFKYMEQIEINYITARAFQIFISFFGKIIYNNGEGKEKIKNLYNKFEKAIDKEKQNSKITGLNTIDVETGFNLKEDIKKIFKNNLTEFETQFKELN